eukprot:m.781004 g.781004  ORF g.781004 m.781004 type:complete len:75 (+) comp23285_c2_seq20:1079-1303(+)
MSPTRSVEMTLVVSTIIPSGGFNLRCAVWYSVEPVRTPERTYARNFSFGAWVRLSEREGGVTLLDTRNALGVFR